MKIISAGIQRPAIIVLAVTSSLLLSSFQAFAQDNSKTSVQKPNDNTFSHDLNAQMINFEAVNPSTKVAGRMMVTINGAVRGNRLWDGQSPVGSHLEGAAKATFNFVPYYPYSPSYSATVGLLQVAGDTKDDSIFFDFGLWTDGSDGSEQFFLLRETVTATEQGAQIAFEQRLPDPAKLMTQQPEPRCGVRN